MKKARKVRQPKKAAATNAGPKKAAATNAGRGRDQPSPIAIAVAVNHAAPSRRAPRRLAPAPPAIVPFARGYNLISQPAPVVNVTPAPEPVKVPASEPVKVPAPEPVMRTSDRKPNPTRPAPEPVMLTRDRKPSPSRPAPLDPEFTILNDILPEAGSSSPTQDYTIQYEGWQQPELYAEAKSRGISGIRKRDAKDKLVALLKKSDL